MDRQDREALFMILERNGRGEIDLFLDEIREKGWDAVVKPEKDLWDKTKGDK